MRDFLSFVAMSLACMFLCCVGAAFFVWAGIWLAAVGLDCLYGFQAGPSDGLGMVFFVLLVMFVGLAWILVLAFRDFGFPLVCDVLLFFQGLVPHWRRDPYLDPKYNGPER